MITCNLCFAPEEAHNFFVSNVTSARVTGGYLYLTPPVLKQLKLGQTNIQFPSGVVFPGWVVQVGASYVFRCAQLFKASETRDSLPLRLDDRVHYRIVGGEILVEQVTHDGRKRKPSSKETDCIQSIVETPPKSTTAELHQDLSVQPPVVPTLSTSTSAIEALVRWIQIDPYRHLKRFNRQIEPVPGTKAVYGWDQRVLAYSYARSAASNFSDVHRDTRPYIEELGQIRKRYDWKSISNASQISKADRMRLEETARWICETWGGVPQQSYTKAWDVFRTAITQDVRSAPMNSGWSKFASFATDGCSNSQTIWDSRVSHSIIWRLDKLLSANGQSIDLLNPLELRLVRSTDSGTRQSRVFNYKWRYSSTRNAWGSHLAGSAVVRQIVNVLNDPANQYPRMPIPNQPPGDWTVFGVGLVLFSDGY